MKSLSNLATYFFGNFQFWQLAILTTFNPNNFHFDNFQFWLLSSKIFELIQQQQQQHIDCMDLAIKNGQMYLLKLQGVA